MQLILTKNEPWNTDYCTKQGEIVYRVECPSWCFDRETTIDVPVLVPAEAGDGSHTVAFESLARIEWHEYTTSTKIEISGNVRSEDELFSKGQAGWNGRDRIFIGPDHREYRWELRARKPELYLNDETQTLIAQFHHRHFGVFHKACPASLEILPQGAHIVDYIVMTFVYISKVVGKKEDEKRRRRQRMMKY